MNEPSFEMTKLNDLKTFLYEWDDVEHEFIDKKLEQKKKQLHKIVEQYLIAIGGKTYPTDKPGWNSVPVEWRLEQPQRYSETVKMLNALCVRIDVASIEQKSLQFDRAIERSHDHRISKRI